MNASARRFLALNSALNGRSFLEVYNNDAGAAAQDLGIATALVEKLDEGLREHQSSYSPLSANCQAEIAALLNFYRCSEFAFVYVPGFGQLTLSSFVETDRNGNVDDVTRQQILSMLVRDIAVVQSDDEVRIADGVFYVNAKEHRPTTTLLSYMLSAYILYRDGPYTGTAKASELIVSLRNQFTLEGYKNFTARQCVDVLKDLVNYPGNPVDFRDTVLNISDFIPVYRTTGSILQDNVGEILWLLDVKGTARCKAVEVPYSTVRSLIIGSLHDLGNVVWSDKGGITLTDGSEINA